MSAAERAARAEAAARRLAGVRARPAPRAALALAEADGRLPAELAALYRAADGLILDGADVWHLGDALGFAGAEAMAREFPGGAAFGWNRSDVVFVLDAEDTMHQGAGAVLGVDKSYPGPDSAVLCAPDLAAFLEAVAGGAEPWRGPRIVDREATALARLLAERPDRVDARPPRPLTEAIAAAATREVELTAGLLALLGVADGLRFVRTGLVIEGAGGLAPLPGARRADGVPAAIRIGRVPDGPDLAVTARDWDRPSDLLLQIGPEGDPGRAPAYGRLLPTLIGWVGSDAENAP